MLTNTLQNVPSCTANYNSPAGGHHDPIRKVLKRKGWADRELWAVAAHKRRMAQGCLRLHAPLVGVYLFSTFVSLRVLGKNPCEKDAIEPTALLSPACAACSFAADSCESCRAAYDHHHITDR